MKKMHRSIELSLLSSVLVLMAATLAKVFGYV